MQPKGSMVTFTFKLSSISLSGFIPVVYLIKMIILLTKYLLDI